MNFRKGTTRFVLCFPSLGIVIKIPVIEFSGIVRVFKYWKMFGWKSGLRLWKIRPNNKKSLLYGVIIGVVANLVERSFWKKTEHEFLQPTWFSFLGLFNIQKYGEPLKYRDLPWLSMRVQVITNQTSHTKGRGHTFGTASNYTNCNGHLKLLDYGDKMLLPVILRYGHEIAKVDVIEFSKRPVSKK